jgi:hypothetical protein
MHSASVDARTGELPVPPIRLRYVVLLALVAGAGLWCFPRLAAAFKLQGLATALGDYGSCMVGPTGPGLLRANQGDEFAKLVRRRLLAAGPNEAPFAKCAPFAKTLTGSDESERAHRAAAATFTEYGVSARPEQSIAGLAVTARPVVDLAHQSWPFVRGYAALVRPSRSGVEAAHPLAPPTPAAGRGLPAARAFYRGTKRVAGTLVLAHGTGANLNVYKSRDGGASWAIAPDSGVEDISERCATGVNGRGFQIVNAGDGSGLLVRSVASDAAPVSARLGDDADSLLAVDCDASTLVAALRPERSAQKNLIGCKFGGACAPIPFPRPGGQGVEVPYEFDVARVQGTTVIAIEMAGIVRVASSRDDGRTWTPSTVVYDSSEYPLPRSAMPHRLLRIGRRLFLHGTSTRAQPTYGLLYSDDAGASFRGR